MFYMLKNGVAKILLGLGMILISLATKLDPDLVLLTMFNIAEETKIIIESKEEGHQMAAFHLNKAKGNVIERKNYRAALEHAEKAIVFLKETLKLREEK